MEETGGVGGIFFLIELSVNKRGGGGLASRMGAGHRNVAETRWWWEYV